MGLDRNFFSDGKGNHRISGIQSIPSKTGLIDSSSFVLKKRLARAEIGGEERNMGLARIETFPEPVWYIPGGDYRRGGEGNRGRERG